jgi:hypothetical protein
MRRERRRRRFELCFAAFLERQGLIKPPPPVDTCARELPR